MFYFKGMAPVDQSCMFHYVGPQPERDGEHKLELVSKTKRKDIKFVSGGVRRNWS